MTRDALTLYFKEGQLLTNPQKSGCVFPFDENSEGIPLGQFNGKNLFATNYTEKKGTLVSTREAFDLFDEKTVHMICRGKHLLYWHQKSQFSGCCGSPTALDPLEMAKSCSTCKGISYPPTHPVIMVLIEKGDEILLAHHLEGTKGMYSILAGFVEPGESCEEAILREVQEEVGLTVNNITYLKSQSWPFPTSLIMGFKASYVSGEILIDEKEIQEAGWYNINNLPPLPPKYSISRQIIDNHLQ